MPMPGLPDAKLITTARVIAKVPTIIRTKMRRLRGGRSLGVAPARRDKRRPSQIPPPTETRVMTTAATVAPTDRIVAPLDLAEQSGYRSSSGAEALSQRLPFRTKPG